MGRGATLSEGGVEVGPRARPNPRLIESWRIESRRGTEADSTYGVGLGCLGWLHVVPQWARDARYGIGPSACKLGVTSAPFQSLAGRVAPTRRCDSPRAGANTQARHHKVEREGRDCRESRRSKEVAPRPFRCARFSSTGSGRRTRLRNKSTNSSHTPCLLAHRWGTRRGYAALSVAG